MLGSRLCSSPRPLTLPSPDAHHPRLAIPTGHHAALARRHLPLPRPQRPRLQHRPLARIHHQRVRLLRSRRLLRLGFSRLRLRRSGARPGQLQGADSHACRLSDFSSPIFPTRRAARVRFHNRRRARRGGVCPASEHQPEKCPDCEPRRLCGPAVPSLVFFPDRMAGRMQWPWSDTLIRRL